MSIAHLLHLSEGLLTNEHGIPFMVDLCTNRRGPGRHRERPQTRHVILFRTKRYPDLPNCSCVNEDICKCAWDVQFECVGQWGETFEDLLSRAVTGVGRVSRCRCCRSLTAWTKESLCVSCALTSFRPYSHKTQQCPICQEDSNICTQIQLACDHRLCPCCAHRLFNTSKDTVRCPACRNQQSKATFAAFLPPPPCFCLPSA